MLAYIDKIPENQRAEFQRLVYNLAEFLKVPANHLMVIMHFESKGTFSPSKPNGSGYYGLIQFGSAAAKDLGTTTAQLTKMTHIQQMHYVIKYFEMRVQKFGKPQSFVDLYLMILYPEYITEPETKEFSSSFKTSNPSFLQDGSLTKQTIYNTFVSKYGLLMYQPQQSPKTTEAQEEGGSTGMDIGSMMPLIQLSVIVGVLKTIFPKNFMGGTSTRKKTDDD